MLNILSMGGKESDSKWLRATREGSSSGAQIEIVGNDSASGQILEADAISNIEQRTNQIQKESLASTNRSYKKVLESEDLAAGNLEVLRMNSEQLSGVENRLDHASHQVKVSDSKADHLKSLNKFFLLPSFSGKKLRKHEKIIEKDKANMIERNDKRVNKANTRSEALSKAMMSSPQAQEINSTPDGVASDDVENQINSNLTGISKSLGKLKIMSKAMNDELDVQQQQIGEINNTAEKTDVKLNNTNKKVYKLMTR